MNSCSIFTLLFLYSLVIFALGQSPDQPSINTPTSAAQCLPTLLNFSGGEPPYTITVIPAGQVGALPITDLGSQPGPNYTWKVNIAGGTNVSLQIRDANGAINYSEAVMIQPSSDSSCLQSNATNNSTSPST